MNKNRILDFIFPTRCPVCDDIVPFFGEKICPQCIGGLKLLTPPWCLRCGKKIEQEEEFCYDCQKQNHQFIAGRALYEYGSAAPSIYRFKYGGRQEYADFFGEEMERYLGSFLKQINPQGILPIPLHKKRYRARGYNQAALLAKALGERTGIPVYEKLLIRTKYTQPLKLQNPSERQNNLKKAFNIGQNDVKLKTILLVDDIYTTGSTMDEAARVLMQYGTEKVYFVTLACGVGV